MENDPVNPETLPVPAVQSGTLFRTEDPAEIAVRATKVADVLANILKRQHLTVRIGKKDHVLVEGWTLCGTMLGVFPICVWTKPVRAKDDGAVVGWEARVEARTRSGEIVGAAEAMAMNCEDGSWAKADYSTRSMAQTRATGKALRIPLGFIMSMAGCEPCPAEEMPSHEEAAERFGREVPVAEKAKYMVDKAKEILCGPPAELITEAERKAIWTAAKAKGISIELLKGYISQAFNLKSGADLTTEQGKETMAWIERTALEKVA